MLSASQFRDVPASYAVKLLDTEVSSEDNIFGCHRISDYIDGFKNCSISVVSTDGKSVNLIEITLSGEFTSHNTSV